jgi:hypothetical protein
MVGRICCTAAALGFAGLGFFGNPAGEAPLNAFGVLFLVLSGVVWFGWDMIADAYAYREEVCPSRGRAFLQTVRLGPVLINGLVRKNAGE